MYTLDLAGNRVLETHTSIVSSGTATTTTTTRTASAYDANDRLTVSGPDADGDGVADPGTATTYGYDPNGSTLSETTGGAVVRYAWDLRGRMAGWDADGDGNLTSPGDATYSRDPDGHLVGRSVVAAGGGADAPRYLVDAHNPTGYSQVVQEAAAPGGAPLRSYVLGLDVPAQRLSSERGSHLWALLR